MPVHRPLFRFGRDIDDDWCWCRGCLDHRNSNACSEWSSGRSRTLPPSDQGGTCLTRSGVALSLSSGDDVAGAVNARAPTSRRSRLSLPALSLSLAAGRHAGVCSSEGSDPRPC